MKICYLLFAVLLSVTSFAQNDKNKKDEFPQIRKYWFVLLKTGPNRTQDSATVASIQREHLNNIDRLYSEGKIKVAGPFGEPGDWRGIFIFDAESKEEVEKLLQSDVAISSGRLGYEIKAWYTSPIGSFVPGKPRKEKPN
jgi:uncharacterized protein YciI